MKKHLIAVLLVAVMCLSAFSACSLVGGLEKDVEVSLKVGNETWGPYTVNAFNNAIVPEAPAPVGKMFYGWTANADWQSKDFAEVAVSQNKGLIRYDDVKDYLKGESSITLYPVFGDIPRHDVAIAWYDKKSTSGLTQEVIDDFEKALRAFLTEQGKTPDAMDIVIRGYQGDVGTTCNAIKNDGDVDIMVGWSTRSNLEGTGGLKAGVDFLQNYGNITLIGAEKARYAARLGDSDLTKLVYDWILTTYGGGNAKKDYDVADEPVIPDPDPDPTPDPEPLPDTPLQITDKVLTVSIWNNPSGAWINNDQIEKLKTDFAEYLTKRSVDVSELTITWKVEEDVTDVATLVNSVNTAGNIDFIVACGKATSGLTNIEKTQVETTPYMTDGRYVAVMNKDNPRQLATVLYQFMTGKEFPMPEPTPDPDPNPETYDLVVAWYNISASGLTAEIMEAFKTALTEYLTAQGTTDLKVGVRLYEGKVAESCAAIKAAGDVDIMLGWKDSANLTGTGGWTAGTDFLEVYTNICIEPATARGAVRLTDTDLCKQVYSWIIETYAGEGGATKDYPVEATPDPDPDPNPDEPEQITETKLKVSVWYMGNQTNGLSEEQLESLKNDFNGYLTTLGVDVSNISITWVIETATKVADLGASVTNAESTKNPVDFIIACGKNVDSSTGAKLSNLIKYQIPSSKYMAADRYIALLHKDNPNQLAKALYEFMTGEAYPANA